MRAAVVERYGPPEVVRVAEVEAPVPRPGQVLVRVEAAGVTSGDARIRGARFPPGFAVPARLAFGLRRPRRPVLGGTFGGTVLDVGPGASGSSPGDVVCGMTGMRLGTHAEVVAVAADHLVPVPAGVSVDDAAGVLFGGHTAWHFLHRKAQVRPGSAVLVNGASGAIGTIAVQLAADAGAEVTGVTSGGNAELVRSLGATHVIDHTRHDVRATPERFDVILDTVGNLSVSSGRALLRPGGTLALVVAGLGDTLRARGDVVAGSAPERVEDLAQLVDRVADGRLRVVHDTAFALDDIVAAHRLVDSGHKRGSVLVHP